MNIIELSPAQAVPYQSFFLQGLTQHGDCFRISPRDESREPFPTKGMPDSFTLAALSEADEWMGVVSFQREGETRERLRHKGLLFRMYVAAQHAGKGVGQELLREVIQRARQLDGLEQINLTVIATNLRAKRLYESVGFSTFSVEKKAIKSGSEYFTEEQMVLFL